MGLFRFGTTYRYARPYDGTSPEIGGVANYFFNVRPPPGRTLPLLESGINPVRTVAGPDGDRIPALLISSSPHKVGLLETPWQDSFQSGHGFIRYFGDNKSASSDPAFSKGNSRLLEQFRWHTAATVSERRRSCPIIFFRRLSKGYIRFEGCGVVERAERITQYRAATGEYFSNYVFDFAVLSLASENESFDWQWINARRDPSLPTTETEQLAPQAWKHWVRDGSEALERLRRRVSTISIVSKTDQRPAAGSVQEKALAAIYAYYNGRKHRFEGLASRVCAELLSNQGARYRAGWITPPSGDHGADFIGRLDLGTGFARTSLVVLGQAKCEKLDAPTGGNHIARTVARLKRGWLGAYVTTSYFSASVQREVIEDQYPLMLVHGLDLSLSVLRLMNEAGTDSVPDYLDQLDERYLAMVSNRRPEEILLD